jgi:hypothetical protein
VVESSSRGSGSRARLWAPLAAAGLLLAVIVGVASRPGQTDAAMPAAPVSAVAYVLDVLFFLALALGLLILAAIVWALWPRPGEQRPLPMRPPPPWWMRMVMALLPLVLLTTMLAVAATNHRKGQPPLRLLGPPPPPAPVPPAAAGASGGGAALAAAITVAVLLALAAIVITLLVLRSRARRRTGAPRTHRQALAEAVDESLDALRATADPRRAVIAAYAALERALSRAGLPRGRHEAPFEYVPRALDRLPDHGPHLHRLAELFELAKFSRHDIDPAMRDEALRALTAVREGLRPEPAAP